MSDQIKAWQGGACDVDVELDKCDDEESDEPEDGRDDEPSLCGISADCKWCDDRDLEQNLGSFDRMMDQRKSTLTAELRYTTLGGLFFGPCNYSHRVKRERPPTEAASAAYFVFSFNVFGRSARLPAIAAYPHLSLGARKVPFAPVRDFAVLAAWATSACARASVPTHAAMIAMRIFMVSPPRNRCHSVSPSGCVASIHH
jgi:hypothetical protein